MKEKKNPNTEGSELQQRFDSYVKRTIRYAVSEAIRSYVARLKKEQEKVDFHDLELLAAPIIIPESEKIRVNLGVSVIYLDDEILAAQLDRLSDANKQLIAYFYVMELPVEKVAEILNVEKKTVLNKKYIVLKKLRDSMKKDGDKNA